MSRSIENFKPLLSWFYLGIALTVLYSVLHHRGFLPEPSMWLNIIRSETTFVPNYEKSQDSQVNTPLMQLIPKGTPVHLLVEKSARKLSVYSSGKWIKSYPVVFGSENTHPKIVEGDMRTPEGLYRVIDVYDHQDWSKFIWLDYPNTQDWQRHFLAKWKGKVSWLLPIGGEIGIHGVPYGTDSWIDLKNDWTLGCISLKNQDVIELSEFIRPGTEVLIVP